MLDPASGIEARRSTRRVLYASAQCLALLGVASLAGAEVGTLQLDSGSHVSFGEHQNIAIPSGGSIRFEFGATGPDGAIPITVNPANTSIPPIPVEEGVTIAYALAAPATGTIRKVAGRIEIELFATLTASLRESPDVAPLSYQLRFTTGTARASNAAISESVSLDGVPASATNYVQLVGAATNRPDAFPGPGEAVYAVLSGRFDSLPALP